MKGLAFRTLVFTHRWVGVAIGLLMLLWCLSGFVMMYVPYPEPERSMVYEALKPLNNVRCCVLPDAAHSPNDLSISAYRLQMLGNGPALRLDSGFGRVALFDMESGARRPIDEARALEAARLFAQAHGLSVRTPQTEAIESDQWTVYGSYDVHRPLYRIRLHDSADTVLYISGTDGGVVQWTHAGQRFWNWLGAVPHWLYFKELRQNVMLWTRIVVWTSIAGCFLAVFGIGLGIWQLRRKSGALTSPYRGVKWWHHVPGVIFGVFVLTWVMSGLFSMQPWGWLETSAEDDVALLRGEAPTWEQIRPVLQRLPQAALPPNTVSIESAFFGGNIYSVATTRSGQRQRFDAEWNPVSLSNAELAAASAALGNAGTAPSAHTSWQLLTDEDLYYYSHGSSKVALPVVRMVTEGPQSTRYYLDPVSGALLSKVDTHARAYRWLHLGLHRWDFPLLRERPTWDLVMWLLLLGVTAVTATGAYLGVRRLAGR